jgi:preprotein translocase subunit SecG
LTGGLALTFFITSLSLSYLVSTHYQKAEQQAIPQQTSVPEGKFPVPDSSKSGKQ